MPTVRAALSFGPCLLAIALAASCGTDTSATGTTSGPGAGGASAGGAAGSSTVASSTVASSTAASGATGSSVSSAASSGGAAGAGDPLGTGGAGGTGGGADAAVVDASSAGGTRVDAGSDAPSVSSSDASFVDSGSTSIVAAGVRWIGRVDTTDAAGPRFGWSGTGFVARFEGISLSARLANAGAFVFKAVVDGMPQPAFATTSGQGSYPLASGLAAGMHTVALYRQTEGNYGDSQLLGLTVAEGALVDPPAAPARTIEVVGASVSCGYGDLGTTPCAFSFATESHWDTYASVAGRALGADVSTVAISGHGAYRNADGTTSDTMPKLFDRILAGSAQPAWDFRVTPQVVVVNLGKNDLVLGDPGPVFRDTYLAFTRTLRTRYPKALIVCTAGPNLGEPGHTQQTGYLSAVVAMRHGEGDADIEFLDWPEQVAGQIGCDAHPNAAKHVAMGQQLVTLLRARLGW